MPHFLILFLILVSGLAVVIVGVGELCWYGKDGDIDRQYYNEEGDHIYYDRSLIEKKILASQESRVRSHTISREIGDANYTVCISFQ